MAVAELERTDETVGRDGAPGSIWGLLAGTYAFVGVWLLVVFDGWVTDDGYIVFRYVDQLHAGNGWVFNVGEHRNVVTSPLHGVLVAAIATVMSPSMAANVVSVAGLLGGALTLSWWLRRELPVAAAAIPIALLLFRPLHQTWGLETMLFVGVLLIVWVLEMRGGCPWWLIGLAALVRPDAIAIAALKAGHDRWRTGRWPWRGLAVWAATLLPWIVLSVVTFGSPLPSSVGVKIGQRGGYGAAIPGELAAAFTAWWPLAAALAALGVVRSVQRWGWAGAGLAAFVIVQQVAYVVLSVPDGYWWYFAPLQVAVLVYAIIAVADSLRRSHNTPSVGACVAALLVAVAVPREAPPIRHDVQTYLWASDWISDNRPDAATLAAAEVGALGYQLSDVAIYDLTGLVSPNPAVIDTTDDFFIARPDLLLLRVQDGRAAVSDDPLYRDARLAQYREIQRWGELVLYERT